MSVELKPPSTEAEVEAAKKYLRNAFKHAVENEKDFYKTPEGKQKRKRSEAAMRGAGKTPAEIKKRQAQLLDDIAEMAAEVTAGTPKGDQIVDRAIKIWQKSEQLPDFLVPHPAP